MDLIIYQRNDDACFIADPRSLDLDIVAPSCSLDVLLLFLFRAMTLTMSPIKMLR
jgi:hypothetical protein